MDLYGICQEEGGTMLRPMNMDLNNAMVQKAKLEGATGDIITEITYRRTTG